MHDSLIFSCRLNSDLGQEDNTNSEVNLNSFAVHMSTTSQNKADKDFGSYFTDHIFHNDCLCNFFSKRVQLNGLISVKYVKTK